MNKQIYKEPLWQQPSVFPYFWWRPSFFEANSLHISIRATLTSSVFWTPGILDLRHLPSIFHTCSIGFMFREHSGQSSVGICTWFKKSITWAMCRQALSCIKKKFVLIYRAKETTRFCRTSLMHLSALKSRRQSPSILCMLLSICHPIP